LELHDLGSRLSRIDSLPREELVENQTQGIEIALGGDLPTGPLLRGHIAWGSRPGLGTLNGLFETRKTEVGDLDLATAIEHDVGRFEVAVQHSLVVSCSQSGADLPCHLDGLVLR
jgi:hypothetical protein